MQLKPITAIAVLVLIVASLLVSGCTVNLPGTSSPTPTPSGHNQELEKLIYEFKQAENTRVVGLNPRPTFNVIWHNDNSVTLETYLPGIANPDNDTWIAFPTTQDATNYLNSVNTSNYLKLNVDAQSYAFSSQYYNATGHYAQTFQSIFYLGPIRAPSSESDSITQWDNILGFEVMNYGVTNSTS